MSYRERFFSEEKGNHNKFTVLTGLSGCGKDYLLSKMKTMAILPPSIATVSFGERLFEVLQKYHPDITSRDDIKRLLSQEQVRNGVLQLCTDLLSIQPALINTHVVYRQNGSIAFNPDVEKKLNPTNYVFVWTEPEQIMLWRSADLSRKRPIETVDEIALHQDIAMEVTSIIAHHNGSGMLTLWNREDNILDNCDRMQSSLAKLAGYQ